MTEWTEGRKRSFIVSVLRSGTRRWPPKFLTLNEAKTEKKINVKTGRLAQHYLCAGCDNDFPAKDINVDHIIPVVGPEGFVNWDTYIERMYCDKENFQILCTNCHTEKSMGERQSRKQKHVAPVKKKKA